MYRILRFIVFVQMLISRFYVIDRPIKEIYTLVEILSGHGSVRIES